MNTQVRVEMRCENYAFFTVVDMPDAGYRSYIKNGVEESVADGWE